MESFDGKVLADFISGAVLIFGTNVAFIPQYIKIEQSGSSALSKYVCLVFITSSVLRLFFRIGEEFSIYLVLQSIVAIFTQLILLEAIVTKENKKNLNDMKTKNFWQIFSLKGLNKEFWNWDNFYDFVMAVALFNIIMASATYLFGTYNFYFQIIGTLSLALDCTVGLPQLYKNFKNKTTKGLSVVLIFYWVLSDVCKAFYYQMIEVPLQFVIAGGVQIMIDFLLFWQCLFYEKKLFSM
ncbi:PQ-loop repeat-containing protein 1 [Bonamia ostreae]|uniref:PQ-loop repeat-containing protein 1 n=1 Tax=Bonamia ostreae TaxID=126728 RepID=A0ABV2ANU1_9EUKA